MIFIYIIVIYINYYSQLFEHLKVDGKTAKGFIYELVKLKLINKLNERDKSIIYKISKNI